MEEKPVVHTRRYVFSEKELSKLLGVKGRVNDVFWSHFEDETDFWEVETAEAEDN